VTEFRGENLKDSRIWEIKGKSGQKVGLRAAGRGTSLLEGPEKLSNAIKSGTHQGKGRSEGGLLENTFLALTSNERGGRKKVHADIKRKEQVIPPSFLKKGNSG